MERGRPLLSAFGPRLLQSASVANQGRRIKARLGEIEPHAPGLLERSLPPIGQIREPDVTSDSLQPPRQHPTQPGTGSLWISGEIARANDLTAQTQRQIAVQKQKNQHQALIVL